MSDRICDFPGCERRHSARGWCHAHYQQAAKGLPLTPLRPRVATAKADGDRGCEVAGCPRVHDARGLCNAHYRAWQRGTLPESDLGSDEEVTFFRGVVQDGDCWRWLGARDSSGYGRFRGQPAHRWSYERLRVEIPDDLFIDHLCRNRACVNPWHLEPVPNRENILRGVSPTAANARKTHCVHGHEFTPENTRICSRGWRACKACERGRWRR